MENSKLCAFPCDYEVVPFGEQSGVSKREYFAGLAMQGFIASVNHLPQINKTWGTDTVIMAKASVAMADALLKELELT